MTQVFKYLDQESVISWETYNHRIRCEVCFIFLFIIFVLLALDIGLPSSLFYLPICPGDHSTSVDIGLGVFLSHDCISIALINSLSDAHLGLFPAFILTNTA